VALPARVDDITGPRVVTGVPACALPLWPPVTSTVLVPPAVPPITTSLPVKPLTDSLKTAVKVMGAVLVGSACPAAWLIVTVGGVGTIVTVLGSEEEAFELQAGGLLAPPGLLTFTLQPVVRPLTATVLVLGAPVPDAVFVPTPRSSDLTSLPVKPLTDSLKTAVKVMGAVLVGSACPAAWLIVTVGGVGSNVTVLSVLKSEERRVGKECVARRAGYDAINVPPVVRPLTATV